MTDQIPATRAPGFYWVDLSAVWTDGKLVVAEWDGAIWKYDNTYSEDIAVCPVVGDRLVPPVKCADR